MALKSTGLTDIGMGPGKTTNFLVQYEDSLPSQATVKANAIALLSVIENEFTVTTGWFNTPGGKFGTGNRQVVNLNIGGGGGGNNGGYGSAINIDSLGAGPNLVESVKMVFMNEWVEILMSLSGGKWNAGDSSGEGLSQYCGIVRFQAGHYSYYGSYPYNSYPYSSGYNPYSYGYSPYSYYPYYASYYGGSYPYSYYGSPYYGSSRHRTYHRHHRHHYHHSD